MEFGTYTHKGLINRLNDLLRKNFGDNEDTSEHEDLISRINKELKSRSLLETPQMSYNEQIHWIIKDTNFEEIRGAMVALNWTWGFNNEPPNISVLIQTAKNKLITVAHAEESDDYHYFCSGGGFKATRNIYDGVPCLTLDFIVSGWHMDYDSVTSDNYSDEPYTGEIND